MYNAASDLVKEIEFEEVEGMWRTFLYFFSRVGGGAWKGN